MARTKAAVRRQSTFVAAPGQRIGNKNVISRRNSMFKTKTHLSETLQVEVRINGQVLRRMNVRRKSHYFSGNNRLRS